MAMLFYTELFQGSFPVLDSFLEGYNQQELMSSAKYCNQMVDSMIYNPPPLLPPPPPPPPPPPLPLSGAKKKRKRPRTTKTREETESQRMTHIAVERNRRKQMNEHLHILRSLMPNSYVQRGDQASIIGGAIEFVRELEQLLQCLESQKRQRIFDNDQTPLIFPTSPVPNDQVNMVEYNVMLNEETAESKSCLGNVEVKLIGFDGLIKILSRRRPGLLIKTIAALEDLQLHIVEANVSTSEESVLYYFNVKISGEARLRAEDIADSIQQILSSMHANSTFCF